MGADTQEFASLPEAHWCYLTFENEEFSHPVTLQCLHVVTCSSRLHGSGSGRLSLSRLWCPGACTLAAGSNCVAQVCVRVDKPTVVYRCMWIMEC